MKLKSLIFALMALQLVACVTEKKAPEETKPYLATVPPQQVPAKPIAAVANSKSDSIPGHLVIKCRIQSDKLGKMFFCGSTTVKLTNEVTKNVLEQNFKGDRTVIPVAYDGSYTIEVSTKGCEVTRKFSGMTGGMGLTAQFENCGVK